MDFGQADRLELDQMANQIERALRSARIRARIHGGESKANRVRYYLAPHSDSLESRLKAAVQSVAEQAGLPEVHVIRERSELALEVYTPGLRLLPLLDLIERDSQLGILLGMQPDGRPFLFDWDSSNVLISGPDACGKSELLRTFLLSAALTYSPTQLQLIGIDFSGRELLFLNSLPHTLTDVITQAEEAIRMLDWLIRSADSEQVNIAVAVDELNLAPEGFSRELVDLLAKLGTSPGIQVLLTDPVFGESPATYDWVKFQGSGSSTLGTFQVCQGDQVSELRAAYVPVRDLSKAISAGLDHWQSTR
jgi:hypothetical protein